jgi:hypothetical protein
MDAASQLQRRDTQLLAREWLNQVTRLADATGPFRIAASIKLATVPARIRIAIEKNVEDAIHQYGPGDHTDPGKKLAISAVVDTALALEARNTLNQAEFDYLTTAWTTVVGRDLIDQKSGERP